MGKKTKLSPNEREALDALTAGLSVADIADDWSVSTTVVYRAIERARAKLGARTTYQAIALWAGHSAQVVPITKGQQVA